MVLHIKTCHVCEKSVRAAITAQKNVPFTEKRVGRAIQFTAQMQSPSTHKAGTLANTCLDKLTFPYHEARRDKDTISCSAVA